MGEWWSYRLTSFLLFSERTYHRLFELDNTALWPAPIGALLLGLGLLALATRRSEGPARAACALLAAAWLWVAWSFHLQRYATINPAAPVFATGFAVQGLLLLGAAIARAPGPRFTASGGRRALGLGIGVVAVGGHLLLAPLAGRPWLQAEVFGLAPDPTALATLGVLLLLGPAPRSALLWPVPLVWCGLTGLTLAAMDTPSAALAPALAALALLAHGRARRAPPDARRLGP